MKKEVKKKILELKESSAFYGAAYSLDNEKNYTYQDILDFNDDNRYEIIDGELFLLVSPLPKHQLILGELFLQIGFYLRDKTCKVVIAPSDVKFNKDFSKSFLKEVYRKIKNSVQPDIYVLCDTTKFDKTGVLGVPDMIIEVLSPSNREHDKLRKYNLYQKYGVKEYWIVDPEEKLISVFILNNDLYAEPIVYNITDTIKVNIFDKLEISLEKFYKKEKELLERL